MIISQFAIAELMLTHHYLEICKQQFRFGVEFLLGIMARLKFGECFRKAVASLFVGGAELLYSTDSLSFSKISAFVSTVAPFETKNLKKPQTHQTTNDNGQRVTLHNSRFQNACIQC